MATCVIEQLSNIRNESSTSKNIWNCLNQMAANEPPNRDIPSTSSNNQKRSLSSCSDEDIVAAETLSRIMNKSSNSAPATLLKHKNDPSDILLHQLSELCNTANGNVMLNNTSTPFIFESDAGSSTLKSTHLSTHLISCFVVGGEIRLCSPQVYNVILKNVGERKLEDLIREYHIISQPATEEQLISLRSNRALPSTVNTCCLITKTNAERLIGSLIDPNCYQKLQDDKRMKLEPILVQHDCFSGCEGRLFTGLYPNPCIECVQCNYLMTPESFCRHNHNKENQNCHWGFDAVNWRNYIRIHDLIESDINLQHQFTNFIHIDSKERERTLEEDIETLNKKINPMFNSNFPAIAASLLQAQQNISSSSSSGPSTSGIPSTTQGSVPTNNLLTLLQLANANNNNTTNQSTSSAIPQMNNNLLTQLQLATQNIPSNTNNLSVQIGQNINSLSLQQQYLNALRNAIQASITPPTSTIPTNDDSGIPRKRAFTVPDRVSCRTNISHPINNKDNSTNNMNFGTLPSEQQLIALLSQLTTNDNVMKINELINNSISQRVQPLLDENERIKKENEELKKELEVKKEIIARLMLRQQQFPLTLPQITSTSSTTMEIEDERIDVDA